MFFADSCEQSLALGGASINALAAIALVGLVRTKKQRW